MKSLLATQAFQFDTPNKTEWNQLNPGPRPSSPSSQRAIPNSLGGDGGSSLTHFAGLFAYPANFVTTSFSKPTPSLWHLNAWILKIFCFNA